VLIGSLIKTNRGYFFMGVALGKAVVDNITVIAVSPQSPLGQQLMGLKENEVAVINTTEYVIESIE
jgi:transcription elongation GreA/GreB family factor